MAGLFGNKNAAGPHKKHGFGYKMGKAASDISDAIPKARKTGLTPVGVAKQVMRGSTKAKLAVAGVAGLAAAAAGAKVAISKSNSPMSKVKRAIKKIAG